MLIEPDIALAETLFARLRAQGSDGVGITRDTYGAGEQRAHDLIAATARELGLEVARDAALNLYVTLPGERRDEPVVMTGSHLDSVPRGGNYDGAAGVVAGMAVLAGWARAGGRPRRDVVVMGIRAEESAWFPVSYVGSKAAFGLLDAQALESRRADTQRTLAEHIAEHGGHPDQVAGGQAWLRAQAIDSFLELHIEQGPVLIEGGHALGIVTGICGSRRYRHARVAGRYAHSGATPRAHRQDAVVALAALIDRLQQAWRQMEADGHELTLTFGQVYTDARQADFSKVPGLASFSVDIRSRSVETLRRMDEHIQETARAIEHSHGVRFDWGPVSGSQAAVMDAPLRQALDEAARAIGVAPRELPSGAGHDSATFANQGIPTAMLFVRNAHGSHNPEEAMDMADFAAGTRTLGRVLAARAGLAGAPADARGNTGDSPSCQPA
ncbi:Zn-dependent hydrolase [Bordetella bronchiseptica]|uniref:Zn-dependent hydrolase n=1 Tax=Bordetella bronchiseptica TaxID=518 RepID=UPI000460EDDB|nr:Zn-dependent hydrolase [Bordetella bronchiseptica]KDC26011.1 putative N-carbamoyl-L-amino-acid hydrolase [Bordetella bronchiseptica F2]